MTVRRVLNPPLVYTGLSTDEKPAVAEGSRYFEHSPTGELLRVYEYVNGVWVVQPDAVPDADEADRRDDVQLLILATLQSIDQKLSLVLGGD